MDKIVKNFILMNKMSHSKWNINYIICEGIRLLQDILCTIIKCLRKFLFMLYLDMNNECLWRALGLVETKLTKRLVQLSVGI